MTLLSVLLPIAAVSAAGAGLLLRHRPRRATPFIRAHRSTRHRGAQVGDVRIRPGAHMR